MRILPNNQITCIIPTFKNTKGLIKLILYLRNLPCQIIVIDNQPTREKKRFFKKNNIQLYLPQTRNLGFSASINKGALSAKSNWLVILNDDIETTDKAVFQKLVHYAKEHNLSATAPILVKPNGQIENRGYRVLPIGRIELLSDPQTPSARRHIDGLTAACLLIKKSTFDALGGFDERFFAYLEDVDLFLRIKKRGDKFGICDDIQVIHHHMSTSSGMNNFKQKQDFKNWIRLIMKHWDRKTLIAYFPLIILERLRNISGIIKKTFIIV